MAVAGDERALRDLAARLEALKAALGRARLQEMERGVRGAVREARAAHATLLVAERVDAARELHGGAAADRRARLGRLSAGVVAEAEDAAAAEAEDAVQSALDAMRVQVGGETMDLCALPAAVRRESDRARRRKLQAAHADALASMGNLPERPVHARWEWAARRHPDGYLPLWQEILGVDLGALAAEADGFLAATRDLYRDAVGELLRRHVGVPFAACAWHDLLHLFHATRWHADFPAGFAAVAAKTSLARAALDASAAGRIRVRLDLDAPAQAVAVRIPEEIHLVGSGHAGPAAYRATLRALGQALAWAHAAPVLPFEDRALGDEAVAQAAGLLLAGWAHEPRWLARMLRIASPEGVARLLGALSLTEARRTAALVIHGRDLCRDGALGGAAERYHDLMASALLVDVPGIYALADAEPRFAAATRLRAFGLWAVLRSHVRERFDEDWYWNPRAGAFLRELWQEGGTLDGAALSQRLGRPPSLLGLVPHFEEALG